MVLLSLVPAMPSIPLFLFIRVSISAGERFLAAMTVVTMAGSIEPQRVPMMMPSSGVRPMVVSKHLPSLTAEMEEPFPRWQVTILVPSALPPSISIALMET